MRAARRPGAAGTLRRPSAPLPARPAAAAAPSRTDAVRLRTAPAGTRAPPARDAARLEPVLVRRCGAHTATDVCRRRTRRGRRQGARLAENRRQVAMAVVQLAQARGELLAGLGPVAAKHVVPPARDVRQLRLGVNLGSLRARTAATGGRRERSGARGGCRAATRAGGRVAAVLCTAVQGTRLADCEAGVGEVSFAAQGVRLCLRPRARVRR